VHRIQMGLVRKLWGQLTNCGIGPRNASRRDEGLISSVIEVIVGKATFPQVPLFGLNQGQHYYPVGRLQAPKWGDPVGGVE
jgi:hypothetical protein